MAEFAANAAPSATTGISPFHAVYGYEPHMDFDIPKGEPRTLTHDSGKLHAQRQAEALAMSLKQTWVDLKEAIKTSQARVSSRENEKAPRSHIGSWGSGPPRHETPLAQTTIPEARLPLDGPFVTGAFGPDGLVFT